MTTPTDKVRAALEYSRKELWDDWHSHMSEEQFNSYTLIVAIDEAMRELDGMVIVPVEPTEKMIDAAMNNVHATRAFDKGFPRRACAEDYRAMIAPYVKGSDDV